MAVEPGDTFARSHMVDFERRIDFDRLRHYRLERAREALKESECGALLLFDVNNIRYVSGTKIGEWERDKLCRFALLAGDGEPIVWDFGSAAVHHRIYCDWPVPENAVLACSGCAALCLRRPG